MGLATSNAGSPLTGSMPLDVKQLKERLTHAGLEIYRAKGSEICVAERVRSHIMDSGVRLVVGDTLEVRFAARTQRSDYPDASADELFARVRMSVGASATGRGFEETSSGAVEVKDPVDPTRVLDVWHEVTYAKRVTDVAAAIDEIRWVLTQERFVMPERS